MSDHEPTHDISAGDIPAETETEPQTEAALEVTVLEEMTVVPVAEAETTEREIVDPVAAEVEDAVAEAVDEPVVEDPAVENPVVEDAGDVDASDASDGTAPPAVGPVLGLGPKPAPPQARPVPRPPAHHAFPGPTPGAVASHPPTVTAPPALTEAELLQAAVWGRVADDGTVWVREETGEREVGQYADADASAALTFYVRRYADLHAKVVVVEARISATDLSVKEMDATLEHLSAELEAPAAVGDLDGLRRRFSALKELADQRRAVADAERAAAKQKAFEARTAMVEAAEKIAATDPERMQWRPAGEQLRTLLDQWKEGQRHGPRLDRTNEDALWKRFSHARSTFDRDRRRWFSELEKSNASARAEKAGLVAEAEALSISTDWGATSAAYRDLMARWKTAGRAGRKDEDALWDRFRAAQDAFFVARDAFHKQADVEYSTNLEAKQALLDQAERLVPVTDIAAAKAALRTIQDRWEKVGKVPRADVQRVDARLRAVEQAVRDAEQTKWQRSNPETRARAEGAAAQLVAAIAALEVDLKRALDAGNSRKVAEIQDSLQARRVWLEQVERAAADSRG